MDLLVTDPELLQRMQPLALPTLSPNQGESPSEKSSAQGLRIVIGQTRIRCRDAMHIGSDAVIVLDEEVDDPVKIFFEQRLIAHGQLVSIDNKLCVRITQRLKDTE